MSGCNFGRGGYLVAPMPEVQGEDAHTLKPSSVTRGLTQLNASHALELPRYCVFGPFTLELKLKIDRSGGWIG